MNHINQSTFDFLSTLKQNNNRAWFQENKTNFIKEKEGVSAFLDNIRSGLEKTDQIEKTHLYRIYRDVRFSKDKTPYKTHFGGSFTRATKLRRGGYYFHVSPGDSFIGGGFFAPDKDDLYRIRKEIEINDSEFRAIITAPKFVKYFGHLEGNELKTAPRGFAKDHVAIDLLRKKQFYVLHRFTDEEMMQEGIIKKSIDIYNTLRPFFDYMSDVLTTDLNGESIL